MLRLSGSLLVLGAVLVVVTTCRDDRGPAAPTEPTIRSATSVAAASGPVTLVGAGNIAKCGATGDDATAVLLDGIPGTVFAAGDAAYDNGTLTQYNSCYNLSWGRHKARTQPTPGERDYKTANAAGYFGYYGAAAGDPKQGYYSYDLGAWHIVVLNSGSPQLVPTTATSPQVQWLRADLAAHPARCTLAYWHNPLFDSKDAPNTAVRPLWDVLYGAGVDVVVNAHYAFYERFAPQTPAGVADPAQGIREFIVGTGGAEVMSFGTIRANSQVRSSGSFGVLKLTLDDARYSWQFVPVAGKTFSYGANGPQGLAGGKRVIIAISRGGYYGAGSPAAALEHLETYLRGVFGFMGIPNPEFIIADGIQVGPEHREKSIASALQAATSLRAA